MTVIDNTFNQAEAQARRRAARANRSARREEAASGWSAGLQNLRWRSQLQDLWTLSKAQTALTWIMLAALVAMAAVFLLVQASAVATVGREIQELQYELNTIRAVNFDLERQIAEAQSIEDMRGRASDLGFHRATPEETIFIVVPDYPVEPAPFEPFPETESALGSSEPIVTMEEAIKLSLYQTISGFIEGSAD